MKFLIIVDSILPANNPTAKIVMRFCKNSFSNNDQIFILSKKNCVYPKNHKDNITYLFVPNYDIMYGSIIKKVFIFFLKVIHKVTKNNLLVNILDFLSFNKKIKQVSKQHVFDKIIVFSGNFVLQKTSANYCKKNKIKYIAFYTDPFTGNPTNNRRQKRSIKIESKWLSQCEKVLMPGNYIKHYNNLFPNFSNIFYEIEFPCYDNDTMFANQSIDTNLLIHSGCFYEKIRPINTIYELSNKLSQTKFKILNLSNYPKRFNNAKYKNLSFSMLQDEEYFLTMSSAYCYILIDNKTGFQIPSKTFEYLSTNKKIIFIYFNEKSETYNLISKFDNILKIKNTDINFKKVINYLSDNLKICRELPEKYTTRYIYSLFAELIH